MIPELEPSRVISTSLLAVVGPEPADVIKATGKHLVVEIEAASNHPVGHHHDFVVIDDLPGCHDSLRIAPGQLWDADRRLTCEPDDSSPWRSRRWLANDKWS